VVQSSVHLFGAEHGLDQRVVGSIRSAGLRASSLSERSKQALTGPGNVPSGVLQILCILGRCHPAESVMR